jgi:hypothetical protein
MLAQRPRSGNTEQQRETERFRICREWQKAGKWNWTEAELEAELAERLTPPRTMPLFDRGDAAAESRADAAKAALSSAEGRRSAAMASFTEAGSHGLTRYELSRKLGVQQSSVCRIVLDLLRDGELAELRKRRQSEAGGSGCILVLPEFREVTDGTF